MHRRLPLVSGLVALAVVLSLGLVFVAHLVSTPTSVQTHHASKAGATLARSSATETMEVRHKTSAVTPTPVPVLSGWRLLISSIGVNAPIEDVGVTANGDLAVPLANPWTDVGWYQGGPVPGQHGSAVIDGHLNRPGGCCIPAVFWLLKDLKAGDIVTVTGKGTTTHFKVTLVSVLSNNAPTAGIFGNNSGTYLNLITCAGDWIPTQHQTTLRLVVYTTLI
jgi:hypothetical protein